MWSRRACEGEERAGGQCRGQERPRALGMRWQSGRRGRAARRTASRPAERPATAVPAAPPRRQASNKGGPQYSGFFNCLTTIAKTEGEGTARASSSSQRSTARGARCIACTRRGRRSPLLPRLRLPLATSLPLSPPAAAPTDQAWPRCGRAWCRASRARRRARPLCGLCLTRCAETALACLPAGWLAGLACLPGLAGLLAGWPAGGRADGRREVGARAVMRPRCLLHCCRSRLSLSSPRSSSPPDLF